MYQEIAGEAKSQTRMLDRKRLVIDWQLADPAEIRLVKAMVIEAWKNGGPYSRKLVWFWRAAKDAGWDEDEIAYRVLTGNWHSIKMGTDLKQVY